MDEKIRGALADEILNSIQELGTLTGEEKKEAVDNVTKLYKLALEDVKTENDYDEKWNRREIDKKQSELDEQYRSDQLKEQRYDLYSKIGLGVASIILPIIFYGSCFNRGLKFEEDGVFKSTTFKGLLTKIKPKN